jgi:dGTPase
VSAEQADPRPSSQHDVDRILYSSAYRRLTGVTQVVAVGERQLFHNRLAHTQKVAQLARRIAQYVNFDDEFVAGRALLEGGRIDEDSAEAAGLAHDLGHPPFGHIAEVVLDEKCSEAGVDGYEGNAQSLRIVTKLSVRRNEESLELSRRTLDGILKYPWMSDHALAAEKGKWGAYLSEKTEFERVRGAGNPRTNQSPEAAIMDWADDISYAVHDLEDFYRAGFIDLVGMTSNEEIREEFFGKAWKEGKKDWDESDARACFELAMLRIKPFKTAFNGTRSARAEVNELGSSLINSLVRSTTLTKEGEISIADTVQGEVHFLKQLTWQFVINDPSLATLQQGEIRVIGDLFDALLEWLKAEIHKRPQRLPTRLYDLHKYASDESYDYPSEQALAARAVADYISSLTEDQAMDLHSRLHGYARGSVQDTWVSF